MNERHEKWFFSICISFFVYIFFLSFCNQFTFCFLYIFLMFFFHYVCEYDNTSKGGSLILSSFYLLFCFFLFCLSLSRLLFIIIFFFFLFWFWFFVSFLLLLHLITRFTYSLDFPFSLPGKDIILTANNTKWRLVLRIFCMFCFSRTSIKIFLYIKKKNEYFFLSH